VALVLPILGAPIARPRRSALVAPRLQSRHFGWAVNFWIFLRLFEQLERRRIGDAEVRPLAEGASLNDGDAFLF
jgi:hypothetical protein